MYADVDVKKAINNGEVPGPRMQVATRALTPTGLYGPLGYSWEIVIPQGVSTPTASMAFASRPRASHVRRRLDQILL